jgi:twitching motility protein PilT
MELSELLQFTKESGASDLYVSAGAPVMIRMHGDVRTLEIPGVPPDGLPKAEVERMLGTVLTPEQVRRFHENLESDLAISVEGAGRFRANVFQHERGPGGVFRVVPGTPKTLRELDMPSILEDLCQKPHGLVLVTGPTGSGKSTTLASMVDLINATMPGHIITIEDPIEFLHKPKQCMIHQREVGPNTKSFSAALRSALREDPDVVLVGEMRDLETIELALTAAETGHLVFGTLHTSSAWKTVDRIVAVFPADQQEQVRTQLAGSLEAVIAQILLKRADGKGRVAAHEICIATGGVKALIRENKIFQIQSAIQTGAKVGMQTLSASIARLASEGKISRATAEEAQLQHCGAVDLVPSGAGGAPASPAATARRAPTAVA